MKFTEGAFKDWGYEIAKQEFRDRVITEDELFDEKASALGRRQGRQRQWPAHRQGPDCRQHVSANPITAGRI